MSKTIGYKHDTEKVQMSLADPIALHALCTVLTHGAEKYGAYNWLEGMDWSRVYDAALRHLNAFWNGEDIDPESGFPHVDHALCNLMILTRYTRTHQKLDNRPHRRPRLSTFAATLASDPSPTGATPEIDDPKSSGIFDVVSGAKDRIDSMV